MPGRLLEREEQIRHLDGLLQSAAGGSGRVAFLEAQAGLGKTALMSVAARLAGRSGFRVLSARGSDPERHYPWGAVRNLFQHLQENPDSMPTLFSGAAAGAQRLFLGASEPDDPSVGDLTPFPILHSIYWLVANLCRLGPVALLVDDAHELDEVSLQFARYLAARCDDLPLLLLVAARPVSGGTGSALTQLRGTTEPIELTQLSAGAVDQLITERMGARPSAGFLDACRSSTGGNPYYLVELLRDMQERGISATADDARAVAAATPPAIVRGLLLRLAMASPHALPLCRAGAVLGDGSHLTDCARVAQLDTDTAAVTADELIRAGILAEGPGLAFAHPILRAALLSDIGRHERVRWHRRAAQQLANRGADPLAIGTHLLRTEPEGDPATVEVLRRAAAAAIRTASPVEAIDFLSRALAEPPPAELTGDLMYDLGLAQSAAGHPDGLANLAHATAATADPQEYVNRAMLLADLQLRSGQGAAALSVLDRARGYVDEVDESVALRLHGTRYWIGRQRLDTIGSVADELPRLRELIAGPPGPARAELAVYLALEEANRNSRDSAIELIELALRSTELPASSGPDSTVIVAALLALHVLELHDQFDQLADATLLEAGRRGAMLGYVNVSTMRAHEHYLRGQLADAGAEAEAAFSAAAVHGWEYVAPGLMAIRAVLALERGELDEVAAIIAATPGGCDEPMDLPTALLLDVRGLLRLTCGDGQRGLADVLLCGERLEGLGVLNPGFVPWRLHAALGLLGAGDLAQARALAAADLALGERLGGPVAIGGAKRLLGLATPGQDGIELLADAVQVLSATPARLETARALVDLGSGLRRRGQPGAAREHLQRGLDLAARCGSTGLAERAHEELLASGARPRRSGWGPAQLTPSESRVVRLAATGMSNTSIAQSLFITRKTVEKHLASSYRKLGITSKKELGDTTVRPV